MDAYLQLSENGTPKGRQGQLRRAKTELQFCHSEGGLPCNSSILATNGELAMSGHLAFLLLSISLSPTIVAQEQAPKLSREIAASPAQYRVLPGETDRDGCVPKTPARICLGATGMAHCYEPLGNKDYIFALEPKATPVGQLDGHDLTLFTAMFSGCGSGALTDFSLLTVRDEEFVNLLPKVQLTNQSEYKLWSLPRFSKLPILVTADFIWDFDAMQKSKYKEETHLASHRYRIEAFVFDTKSGRYLKKVHYETARKYPGLDEVDEINVLDAERQAILAKLHQGQTY
jgi:hypothetical protein